VITLCPGYIATPMTAKNPYPMPFILSADDAARLMVRAISRGRRFYVFPWQMALAAGLLRALPRPLFDLVFAHAPRKPRAGQTWSLLRRAEDKSRKSRASGYEPPRFGLRVAKSAQEPGAALPVW